MDVARTAGQTAAGIAAGLVASLVMNKFQSGWSAVAETIKPEPPGDEPKQDEPATVKAADRVTDASTGEPVPEPYREPAGEAVHYGFGAILGGLYGAAGSVVPEVRTGFGTLFGTAVWAVADEFAVPAAGLAKPPQDVPASKHAKAILSHLVFGAALEASRRAILGSSRLVAREAKRQFA